LEELLGAATFVDLEKTRNSRHSLNVKFKLRRHLPTGKNFVHDLSRFPHSLGFVWKVLLCQTS